jgi:hypothetical protein
MGADEWMGTVPTIFALVHCIQPSPGNCGAGAGARKNSGLERHCGGVRVSGSSPGNQGWGQMKLYPAWRLIIDIYRPPRSGGSGIPKSCVPSARKVIRSRRASPKRVREARKQCECRATSIVRSSKSHLGKRRESR